MTPAAGVLACRARAPNKKGVPRDALCELVVCLGLVAAAIATTAATTTAATATATAAAAVSTAAAATTTVAATAATTATATIAATAAARRAIFTRTRFVDLDGATFHVGAVEFLHGCRRFLVVRESDETESALAAGLAVQSNHDVGHAATLSESLAKRVLGAAEGEIPHI